MSEIHKISDQLFVKREDLINTHWGGNKYYKLKYNLQAAQMQGFLRLLTFGGAFSNHLRATAAAGQHFGFETIGVVRGEKVDNKVLQFAQSCGMKLIFVSREEFKHKHEPAFIADLKQQVGDFYLIPEGGSNVLAVQGCTEIVANLPQHYDFICCACGTGTTLAGLIAAAPPACKVIGFPVLKNGDFLANDINALLDAFAPQQTFDNWQLQTDYHFGGYAKKTPELMLFIDDFMQKYDIPIEFVYTGKLFFGIDDLIKKGFFSPKSSILAIHSGGVF